MSVPAELQGARVLDVCCRAGKGAYELSDYVGAGGFVLGVDPDPSRIARAAANAADNHWAGSSWPTYLRFQCTYPEDLARVGVRDSSFDLVYINCELNAVWDLCLALSEFARVLRNGGRLWVAQGIFCRDGAAAGLGLSEPFSGEAEDYRDAGTSGNVFMRAHTQRAFEKLCLEAGCRCCSFGAEVPAVPDGDDAAEGLGASSFVSCDACAVR